MPLFGKKKTKDEEGKEKEEHVVCPHCYLDFTVERVQQAGGVCPSCKGKIDLDKLPRAYL
jgi:ribosomal protein L37AE/L43A